ncbi:MAG: hypothetical protein IT318_20165 [Anaerolineales bacterium]|nr:hypothetical protein [Anaerolineales bacterium]
MPATKRKTPKEIVDELCEVQGRKLGWLAERSGMTAAQLTNRFAGRPRYPWRPGQREAIAQALGVPVHYIWEDMAESQQPPQPPEASQS